MMEEYDVPVTVIIFNRPEITQRLADVITEIHPRMLYIVSDAAREDHDGESDKVKKCREIMERAVPEKNQKHIYAEANMGCDKRIVSGLNLVFSDTDRSVVLEDDCIPDPSFFPYCSELLKKYQNTDGIMYISGSNRTTYPVRGSYTFVHNASTWGWATWKRAWKYYRDGRESWQKLRGSRRWRSNMPVSTHRKYIKLMDIYASWETFPWDAAWQLQMFEYGWLSIVPHCNMISNIGYGDDATHLTKQSSMQKWKTESMGFPLEHPDVLVCNQEYVKYREREIGKTRGSIFKRLREHVWKKK